MRAQAGGNSSERILEVATRIAQAHGYSGLNMRDLAEQVGVKAASLYHHFAGKTELAAAVARRYWENSEACLEELTAAFPDPHERLRQYPQTFRISLESDNRICLSSFMGAEYDDLPAPVMQEVQKFAEINIDWLAQTVAEAGIGKAEEARARAQAIYAAIAGAQLLARSRADLGLFDQAIGSYQAAGLLP
ncbi:TetR/AcrR family transcriptional regulator [Pseudomonas oryzihabitans]|uniref:TetR/AcrR family transcriptional regulator n=1 Tax=Pseudomonas oryzihabitans TaxID=47885 RepID=UPI0028938519|nr:TetR/AcrR family transcriptional regulator [Pseudomonas oryzihabitans]MDT3718212.1 TetR/AcrR family transcriptional regulator [Pseudomonas oryzihabitans]